MSAAAKNENSDEDNDEINPSNKERGQSAPAKFDQSMYNAFGIEPDMYAKQFTQGNID